MSSHFSYRCVECGAQTNDLYKNFGHGAVRLTDCFKCGKTADPYVEVDTMYLFLEVFLQKEQVYRHLLFNSENFVANKSRFAVLRLLSGLVLFDAYARWALMQSHFPTIQSSEQPLSYIFLSTLLCSIVNIGSYLGVLTFATSQIYKQEPRTVFHGIILSMFGILFNLLLLTWTSDLRFRYSIQALVYISNMVALRVISDQNTFSGPFFLLCFGALVRYISVELTWFLLFNHFPTASELFA